MGAYFLALPQMVSLVRRRRSLDRDLGTSSYALVVQCSSRRHGIHTGYLRLRIAGFLVMI
jgi:hypothetical protein